MLEGEVGKADRLVVLVEAGAAHAIVVSRVPDGSELRDVRLRLDAEQATQLVELLRSAQQRLAGTEVGEYCCPMRERFVVGIVAKNPAVPDPPELVGFIDWDTPSEGGVAIIRGKFCIWCGVLIAGPRKVCPPFGLIEAAVESGLVCRKCGSPIKSGFCSDELCPYSEHGQGEEFTNE